MNKHFPDNDVDARMMAHTKQVVDMVTELFSAPRQPVRQFGEADDTYTIRTEDRAQTIFFDALKEFRARVQDAAALSDIASKDLLWMLDALADHAPTKVWWDSKIRGEI